MIGLIILPFILFLNYLLYKTVVKWLALVQKSFDNKKLKIALVSYQVIIVICLFLSIILPNNYLRKVLYLICNYWFITIIYALMIFGIDIIIKKIFYKTINKYNSKKIYIIFGTISIILLFSTIIYGAINTNDIKLTKYNVAINKYANLDELNAIMISDIHLGYNFGAKQLEKVITMINKENPDIVFICGDIFDNEYDTIEKPEEIIKLFKNINTKYGVYAVYGNHDIEDRLFLGFSFSDKKENESKLKMDNFLENSNIKLLEDDFITIENNIYVYGRTDYSKKTPNRKTGEEITNNLNKNNAIILLDHEPKELEELSHAGIDLDLSGHTHAGQFFPLNIGTKLAFKNDCGMKKFKNMVSIVSSGIGVHGPKVRIFSHAEIVSIKIKFNGT